MVFNQILNMRIGKYFRRALWVVLCFMTIPAFAKDINEAWNTRLKQLYFQDQEISPANDLLSIELPSRAEDGALVPLAITVNHPQTEDSYIQAMYVIIDENPSPLAGKFELTPRMGSADLAFRIRVNAYSQVRVIAQSNDGQLWMSSQYVKASGGCSAPVGTDIEAAMARLGKMRFRVASPEPGPMSPVSTRLAISHPNITGLQRDQVSTLLIPPHYIKSIDVHFNGERIFSAQTDISISENPNFRFYFIPKEKGVLSATVVDTQGMTFTQKTNVEI